MPDTRPAETPAEHALPLLHGIRVFEFGDEPAAAICTHHLALLGAEVYLLEPEGGCWLRRLQPRDPGSPGRHPLFEASARGKYSASLEAAMRGPETLWTSTDLVVLPAPRRTAGPTLPAHDRLGRSDGPITLDFREPDNTQLSELAAQARFGFSAYLGTLAAAPYRVGFDLVTYSAAVLGVQAVLAALRVRRMQGRSQRIRVPFSRAAASLLNNVTTAAGEPDQKTPFSRAWESPPYLGLPTADGDVEILFYGPGADEGWQGFCEQIGAAALGTDPRFAQYAGRSQHAAALRDALAPFTARIGREALLATLWSCGAMAVPRWGIREAAESQQARANAMVSPARVGHRAPALASPWSLDGRRAHLQRVPTLQADTPRLLAGSAQP